MKTLLAVFTALMIQGCSKPADAQDNHVDNHEACKCETKLSAVKKFKSTACPNEYPLYQGYYSDKDGTNAWCRKLESTTCVCDEVK